MPETIRQSALLNVEPKVVYDLWFDSSTHEELTGKPTDITKKVGSDYTLLNGYFDGKLELMHMNKRIIHTLRSDDYTSEDVDSTLEVLLDVDKNGKTKVTIIHADLPDGEGKKYRKIWRDNYISKLKEFFKKD